MAIISNEDELFDGEIIEEDVLLPEDEPHLEQETSADAVVEGSEPWWRFGEKWLQFGTKSYKKPTLWATGVSIFVHLYGTVYICRFNDIRSLSLFIGSVLGGIDTMFVTFAFFLSCIGNDSNFVWLSISYLFLDLIFTAVYTFFLLNWVVGVFKEFDSRKYLGIFIKCFLAAVISLLDHGLLIWLCMLYKKELKDAEEIDVISSISYSPIVFRPITPVPTVSVSSVVINNSNTYNIGTININNGTLQALEAVRDIAEERPETIGCESSIVDETGE